MRCQKARKSVSLALDHRLDSAGRAGLDHHLADCPSCRRWSEEQSWLHSLVKDPQQFQPSPGFHTRLRARTSAQAPRLQSWLRLPLPSPLLVRAAFFLMFVFSTLLGVFLGYRLDRPAPDATAKAFSQALHLDALADAPAGSFAATYDLLLRGELR